MPSAAHKTQVGGGRQISSLDGFSCGIGSCRKVRYTMYITSSHDIRMGSETLIELSTESIKKHTKSFAAQGK